MRTLLKFLSHVGKVAAAEKGKRVFYAFIHILGIALGIAAFLGALWLLNYNTGIAEQSIGGWILVIIGMVILFVFAVLMFIEGFLAQLVLMICAFIGLRNPEERGYCLVASVVSALSIVAAVIAAIVLVNVLM